MSKQRQIFVVMYYLLSSTFQKLTSVQNATKYELITVITIIMIVTCLIIPPNMHVHTRGVLVKSRNYRYKQEWKLDNFFLVRL